MSKTLSFHGEEAEYNAVQYNTITVYCMFSMLKHANLINTSMSVPKQEKQSKYHKPHKSQLHNRTVAWDRTGLYR